MRGRAWACAWRARVCVRACVGVRVLTRARVCVRVRGRVEMRACVDVMCVCVDVLWRGGGAPEASESETEDRQTTHKGGEGD